MLIPKGHILGLLGKFCAVNALVCLVVQYLFSGPNGAGKSTTLSMVSGEVNILRNVSSVGQVELTLVFRVLRKVTPTSGNVWANGHHMRYDTVEAIESMGCCPQTDTLWEDLKMTEHFELFAALNDLPKAKATAAIK